MKSDHPLWPLIEAYTIASVYRCALCSDENIDALKRATEDLNKALAQYVSTIE